jgi:Tfp pilus assembly protein PilN
VTELDLNLSTRPFPRYRLINTALALGLAGLLIISAWQAVGFVRYSRLARRLQPAEIDARVEAESLGKQVAEVESRLDRPEATAKLNEIGFLNHLIARKSLSWTRLFGDLENLVPNNVHLVALRPDIGANGAITLQIELQARSVADASEFIHRLEKSPVFQNITVSNEQRLERNESTDIDLKLAAVYLPERESK